MLQTIINAFKVKEIRRKVFMQEQGFAREFDEVDKQAAHFLAVDELGVAQATARVYFDEGREAFVIGRFAVSKEIRGKNIGRLMVDSVRDYVIERGASMLLVHAQVRALPFYQKVGFVPFGEVDEDEGVPHIWMQKSL